MKVIKCSFGNFIISQSAENKLWILLASYIILHFTILNPIFGTQNCGNLRYNEPVSSLLMRHVSRKVDSTFKKCEKMSSLWLEPGLL